MNLKNIHIGNLVQSKVNELEISIYRIENFLECDEKEIRKMYLQESMDTNLLLRWSKLLAVDFFRIYTGHLILYAPPSKIGSKAKERKSTLLFRKNIYTQEVKNFILEKIQTEKMTISEVILRYKIPKTTLHKWIKKV